MEPPSNPGRSKASRGTGVNNRENSYRTILENISDGAYFCDRDQRITYWNAGAERITGFTGEQMRGSSYSEAAFMHVDERGASLSKEASPLSATLVDGLVRETQAYLHHCSGHRVPVLVRTIPIYGPDGEIEGVAETFSDSSALLAALRRVNELSVETETDPLTGIGNRKSMEVKLDACITECCRLGAIPGVLFCDIDHFKNVNDTFGHEVGDRVLKMVAETLKNNLRTSDVLARWGGEEFMALLHHVTKKSLAATAERLRMLVADSYLQVDGTQLRVTISLGATPLRPSDTPQTLVARADSLLYRSKSEGRNRYTLAA
jgi:diguanylate cyclase (GGDEF)-like protein/PAS domain S-box-containing protein